MNSSILLTSPGSRVVATSIGTKVNTLATLGPNTIEVEGLGIVDEEGPGAVGSGGPSNTGWASSTLVGVNGVNPSPAIATTTVSSISRDGGILII